MELYNICTMAEEEAAECKQLQEFICKATYEGVDDIMEMYKQWAPNYDRDCKLLKRRGPYYAALYLSKTLGSKKDAGILDVAAGTGLVAGFLKEFGFTNIDALDGSKEMLDIAKEKNLYKNYHCEMLTDKPTSLSTGEYDAVVCAGGFAKGLLQPNCIQEIIRLVCPGGVIVLCHREDLPQTVDEYKDLPVVMGQLEEQGLWKLVDKQRILDYFPDKPGLMFTYEVIRS